MIWYHLKQSFRRKSEDIRRPLIPGENIDQVYRQKERERKRKKLVEKKKIIPGRASDSQLYYIKDNSSIKCRLHCIVQNVVEPCDKDVIFLPIWWQ